MKPSQDSHDKCELKLTKGHIFLTITFNDRDQKANLDSFRKRIRYISDKFRNIIKPKLIDCMDNFDCTLEISEALASKGSYYPRLHYHILGYLNNPIYLLLVLGYFYKKHEYGYHVISSLTEEQFKDKYKYLLKQREQWKLLKKIIDIPDWMYRTIYNSKTLKEEEEEGDESSDSLDSSEDEDPLSHKTETQ